MDRRGIRDRRAEVRALARAKNDHESSSPCRPDCSEATSIIDDSAAKCGCARHHVTVAPTLGIRIPLSPPYATQTQKGRLTPAFGLSADRGGTPSERRRQPCRL